MSHPQDPKNESLTTDNSEQLTAEAVKALRTAVRRGGVDANRIRAAKAFTRLSDRADFRELLDELNQPQP